MSEPVLQQDIQVRELQGTTGLKNTNKIHYYCRAPFTS